MLNNKAKSYIVKVLEQGYPPKQVAELLEKKGFGKDEIDKAITEAMQVVSGKSGFKKRVEEILHKEFLSKTDKFIAAFSEKMLKKGYFADQIKKTLVDDGYDEKNAGDILSIVEKRLKREEELKEIFNEIFHPGKIDEFRENSSKSEKYDIKHHEWIKLGIVSSFVLIAFAALLFTKNIYSTPLQLMEIVSLAAGMLIALPTGAYSMHHISMMLHKKEIRFNDAVIYLLGITFVLMLSRIFFSVVVMIVLLIPAVYFFTYMLEKNYEIPESSAFILSFSGTAITFIVAYTVMTFVGLIMGLYMVFA